MLNLAEYRRKPDRLSDHLPWAALVGPGVILNKDGSFLRSFRFRGPDLDSATDSELQASAARINNVLRRLGSAWAMFVEARREEAASYPACEFPDPISALVDAERRAQFESGSTESETRRHYESQDLSLPVLAAAAGSCEQGREASGRIARRWERARLAGRAAPFRRRD